MSGTSEHQLIRNWRVPRAAAKEADALQIRDTLEHLVDLVELFEYDGDEEMVTQLRTLIGHLRSKASDREEEAAKLEGSGE